MTGEEAQALLQLIARESDENRNMAKKLIEVNGGLLKRLVDVMVDRRLCKLDQAEKVLTDDDDAPKPLFQRCTRSVNQVETCATHLQSIWDCAKEMADRLDA